MSFRPIRKVISKEALIDSLKELTRYTIDGNYMPANYGGLLTFPTSDVCGRLFKNYNRYYGKLRTQYTNKVRRALQRHHDNDLIFSYRSGKENEGLWWMLNPEKFPEFNDYYDKIEWKDKMKYSVWTRIENFNN